MSVLSSLLMGQLLDGRFDELDEKDEALAATLAALLDGSRAYFEPVGSLGDDDDEERQQSRHRPATRSG